MPRPPKMNADEITQALATLDGWTLQAGKLHKTFTFTDFIAAWGWMSRAALIAQSLDHHPEWFNVYGTVRVDLNTHDADGITRLDIELATRMNALL